MKEERVLLVRIVVGKATARKIPLKQDQRTKILSVDKSGNANGIHVEMIQALKIQRCYYRMIELPDQTVVCGNILFEAKHYAELKNTPLIRKGISKYIENLNLQLQKHIRFFELTKERIESNLEDYGV